MAITEEDFEELIVRFGPDMDHWPDAVRNHALDFAVTPAGRAILAAEEALEPSFARLSAVGGAQAETACASGADAYMQRLLQAPDRAYRPVGAVMRACLPLRHLYRKLTGMFDTAYEWPKGVFSPLGLAAQAACASGVLVLGLWVGMAGSLPDTEEVDLSVMVFTETLSLEEDMQTYE